MMNSGEEPTSFELNRWTNPLAPNMILLLGTVKSRRRDLLSPRRALGCASEVVACFKGLPHPIIHLLWFLATIRWTLSPALSSFRVGQKSNGSEEYEWRHGTVRESEPSFPLRYVYQVFWHSPEHSNSCVHFHSTALCCLRRLSSLPSCYLLGAH